MFRIGEFSKMGKTTIKTLRYYDEEGLLKPEKIDKFTGHRYYGTEQLITLHRIQSFRQLGISIDEIKLLLSGKEIAEFLKKRKSELIQTIVNAKDAISKIEFILNQEEDYFMSYNATIKELPECIVYSKNITVPSYDAYFDLIPEIGRAVKGQYPDLKCSVPEYCYIEYLDREYKEKNFKVEFCEAVESFREDFDDIKFKKINAVTAVSVMHKGPYSELSKAYSYIFKWIENNGYKALGAPRESYIDGIWNKDSEEEWLTELQIPVEKVN
ncbi:MAG TPA: MerR family transcriptional regulator [Eubacteriaceae bacterium]|nr:MerR family transcriptional regulator [Eubacteriaceae bacterium]